MSKFDHVWGFRRSPHICFKSTRLLGKPLHILLNISVPDGICCSKQICSARWWPLPFLVFWKCICLVFQICPNSNKYKIYIVNIIFSYIGYRSQYMAVGFAKRICSKVCFLSLYLNKNTRQHFCKYLCLGVGHLNILYCGRSLTYDLHMIRSLVCNLLFRGSIQIL